MSLSLSVCAHAAGCAERCGLIEKRFAQQGVDGVFFFGSIHRLEGAFRARSVHEPYHEFNYTHFVRKADGGDLCPLVPLLLVFSVCLRSGSASSSVSKHQRQRRQPLFSALQTRSQKHQHFLTAIPHRRG